ncbi:aminoglycoside phosphotransferase family protein [Flaviflagellibacter deserti]|uniref:Aminoglycoside phosphotransferase family protein n=1 Tax=Flaviflagellibacter deserti TaxID=2267266 RepID=A0ABV9Z1V7_9HYPH
MFDEYLGRWKLTPDGPPIETHSSQLLPVRYRGEPAMLKVSHAVEEKLGHLLMNWWDGRGAARVFAHDDDAILLERAEGKRRLTEYARDGRDDEATRILCDAIAELHTPRGKPLPDLVPLTEWFRSLWPAAEVHGGLLALSARTARDLLSNQKEIGVLHGDVHHDNVLDFGARGWLAIDPKRILGDRAFDYANLFCNPEDAPSVPKEKDRFLRRVEIVSDMAGIERTRLLRWILAWTGLSAAWWFEDDMPAEIDMAVGQMAASELGYDA